MSCAGLERVYPSNGVEAPLPGSVPGTFLEDKPYEVGSTSQGKRFL